MTCAEFQAAIFIRKKTVRLCPWPGWSYLDVTCTKSHLNWFHRKPHCWNRNRKCAVNISIKYSWYWFFNLTSHFSFYCKRTEKRWIVFFFCNTAGRNSLWRAPKWKFGISKDSMLQNICFYTYLHLSKSLLPWILILHESERHLVYNCHLEMCVFLE